MFLFNDLMVRFDANNPVRVSLIGAGKFGCMFLSQVPTIPEIKPKKDPIINEINE